jgi:hypothetical protein
VYGKQFVSETHVALYQEQVAGRLLQRAPAVSVNVRSEVEAD